MTIIRTASLYGRRLNVHSHPRAIAGGAVVWVSWATNDDAPASVRLRNGSVHPCHAAGFTWEECATNLAD